MWGKLLKIVLYSNISILLTYKFMTICLLFLLSNFVCMIISVCFKIIYKDLYNSGILIRTVATCWFVSFELFGLVINKTDLTNCINLLILD